MAAFFPLSGQRVVHWRYRPMQLRTVAGVVELKVAYGQDPGDRHWGCPVRELWGLTPHQQLSLALEDKLAFTLTATASYEAAAALAQKWGVPVTDSALHSLTRRLGTRAEAQAQEQLKTPPVEREPERAPTKLAVLMVDGWQVRQRGPGWGKKKTQENRVEWHEWKTGVYYRQEQSAHTAGGRGLIDEKIIIGWQGDPVEFGRRLHWAAQGEGLGRAQATLVVGDGAPWIWNLAQDRWAGATKLLDFYHASQHLWDLGRALHKNDEAATARWVEPRRHQLRHGKEKQLLAVLLNDLGLDVPRAVVSQTWRQRASVRSRLRSHVCTGATAAPGGKTARQTLVKLLHVFLDAFLVALDGQQVVATSFLHNDSCRFGLGVEGVGRHQRAFNFGPAEQGLHGGDFIGAFRDQLGTEPAPLLDGVGAGDLQAPAVEQLLAVHRHLIAVGIALPQHGVLPFQQRFFQLPAVEVGEQPEKGGLAGRAVMPPPPTPVARKTQGFHLLIRQVGGKSRQIPLAQADLAEHGANGHRHQTAHRKIERAVAPIR
jgi:hypothetical protein